MVKGACMAKVGYAWQRGVCVAKGGVCVTKGGMCGRAVCMAGGMRARRHGHCS